MRYCRYAKAEQERRKARMAVNPPGLFLKRLQQAKKMYGYDSAPASPTLPVRMDKKVFTALQTRFDSGARGSGMGSGDVGNDSPPGQGQSDDSGTNGQR